MVGDDGRIALGLPYMVSDDQARCPLILEGLETFPPQLPGRPRSRPCSLRSVSRRDAFTTSAPEADASSIRAKRAAKTLTSTLSSVRPSWSDRGRAPRTAARRSHGRSSSRASAATARSPSRARRARGEGAGTCSRARRASRRCRSRLRATTESVAGPWAHLRGLHEHRPRRDRGRRHARAGRADNERFRATKISAAPESRVCEPRTMTISARSR